MRRKTIDPGLVLDILPREGRESAVVGRQLALSLGCTLRDVAEAIQILRLRGFPVLSDPAAGYWLYSGAEGDDHAARMCVASLTCRIQAQEDTLRCLRQSLALERKRPPPPSEETRVEAAAKTMNTVTHCNVT